MARFVFGAWSLDSASMCFAAMQGLCVPRSSLQMEHRFSPHLQIALPESGVLLLESACICSKATSTRSRLQCSLQMAFGSPPLQRIAPVAYGLPIPESAITCCEAMLTACIPCASLQMAFGLLQPPKISQQECGVPCLASASILLGMGASSPWPYSPEAAYKAAEKCAQRVQGSMYIQEVLGCWALTGMPEPGYSLSECILCLCLHEAASACCHGHLLVRFDHYGLLLTLYVARFEVGVCIIMKPSFATRCLHSVMHLVCAALFV